jgi:hypothetical protein
MKISKKLFGYFAERSGCPQDYDDSLTENCSLECHVCWKFAIEEDNRRRKAKKNKEKTD